MGGADDANNDANNDGGLVARIGRMSHPARLALRSVLRLLLVATTAIVAFSVPLFAEFFTLLGALALAAMVYVLPPLFAWRILDFKLWEKLAALATVAVGVTGAVIGSYQA